MIQLFDKLASTKAIGKTTLIKLITGSLVPQTGTIFRAENKSVYIDQDYSLINYKLRVYDQVQQFNDSACGNMKSE